MSTPPTATANAIASAPAQTVTLQQLLKAMVDKGASDLHLSIGSPPQLRIDGDLVPLRVNPLNAVESKQLCYSILTDVQKAKFEEEQELDLSFGVKNLCRFRANVFLQRGVTSMAIRQIPYEIFSCEQLGLPKTIRDLTQKQKGMILITGPTGS